MFTTLGNVLTPRTNRLKHTIPRNRTIRIQLPCGTEQNNTTGTFIKLRAHSVAPPREASEENLFQVLVALLGHPPHRPRSSPVSSSVVPTATIPAGVVLQLQHNPLEGRLTQSRCNWHLPPGLTGPRITLHAAGTRLHSLSTLECVIIHLIQIRNRNGRFVGCTSLGS